LELLQLVRYGNYAQLVDHHFWPLSVLRFEDIQLHQALLDLVDNIWNFLEEQSYQSLLTASHQTNMVIDVDNESTHSLSEVRHQAGLHDISINTPLCSVQILPSLINEINEGFIGTHDGTSIAPQEQLGALDHLMNPAVKHLEKVAEITELKVAEEDPSAIFALQEQHFNTTDHSDNILETGINIKAHLRTISLNINGLAQQKLPIILTYII